MSMEADVIVCSADVDALAQQAFIAISRSPGARAYYDKQRARGLGPGPPCASSPTAWSASCTAA